MPSVFIKKHDPVPSSLYPILWKFAFERQNIYLNRMTGNRGPWSTNPIFLEYKFTNAFRAADRVSQYLIANVIPLNFSDQSSLLLSILFFKIFNKIETWEYVARELGFPAANKFNIRQYGSILSNLSQSGKSIYSAAYIMPSGGGKFPQKHIMHLELLKDMIQGGLATKISNAKSLEEVYKLFLSFPTIGPFLAFQYTIDVNYSQLCDFSEMDFVVAGPGAHDGLSKCFESFGDYTAEDVIRWLTDRQQFEFKNNGFDFPGLFGRPLQLIDMQNILCEVSKYTRVSNPDVIGKSGRTRIKQKFLAKSDFPMPKFPEKWQLAESIEKWAAKYRNQQSRQLIIF